MRPIEVLEYSLILSTQELLLVTEIQQTMISDVTDIVLDDILQHCTRVPHDVLQDAKIGGTKPLEKLLRTPPQGCLVKLVYSTCSELQSCSKADRQLCSTTIIKRKKKTIPRCWQAQSQHENGLSRSIGTTIVHAWKDGRYVFIVY
jgi:hypothetical protein